MKRVAFVVLAGCYTMAPKYERPAAPVPVQLPGGAGEVKPIAWQELVREPKLRKIVDQALAQNRDLRRAALQIEAARAQYRIQRAQQFPSIDASVNVTSTRQQFAPGIPPQVFTTYNAGVGLAGWEIDLFGRLKSLADAKLQAYFAQIETARATKMSLIGEVCAAYLTLAADRSRIAIARDTMTVAKRTMELTEQLVGGGTSNRGDYYQAATVYEQARADVALLEAAIAQDRDALELLAGGAVADDLLPDALPPQQDWFADVPVGLSSTVLLQRPDVQAAEHALMAANANIGEARAEFFPHLSLTASGGLASLSLAALFTGPTAVFTIAGTLAQPLFRGGAGTANLQLAHTQKRIAIVDYEAAIQRAFRETADALATRATIAEQLSAQTALVEASQKAVDLAEARYKAGIEPFLATLVAQRALYAAKSALVATQLAALGNRVTLYRVLGGA